MLLMSVFVLQKYDIKQQSFQNKYNTNKNLKKNDKNLEYKHSNHTIG